MSIRASLAWLIALFIVSFSGFLPESAARVSLNDEPDFLVDRWETVDGLPEDSVTAVIQARNGYLWIGSFNGLARFDGVRFKVFNSVNTPALPSDEIINVCNPKLVYVNSKCAFKFLCFESQPRPINNIPRNNPVKMIRLLAKSFDSSMLNGVIVSPSHAARLVIARLNTPR